MRAFLIFIFVPAFLCSSELHAQHHHPCATSLYNTQKEKQSQVFREGRKTLEEALKKKKEGFRVGNISAEEKIYIIPVVVHIVKTTSMPEISEAQILSQIEVMNRDYRRKNSDTIFTSVEYLPVAADPKIEFCLATRDPSGNVTNGIAVVSSSKSFFRLDEDAFLKSLSYWPSDQYLNLWVTDLEKDPFGNDYLGYAQFPDGTSLAGLPSNDAAETDGVVIDYKAFGTTGTAKSPYNLGRTTTHEVGHWLGLLHPWGGIEGNDPNCGTDYVNDTPPANGPNLNSSCTPNTNTCGGVFRTEMEENYMDYSPDKCMNVFTQGQKDRMRSVMELSPRRNALLSSPGCCNPQFVYDIPFQEGFENNNLLGNNWQIINHGSDTSWVITSPGASGESLFSIYVNNDNTNVGSHDVLVTPFLNFEEPWHLEGKNANPVMKFKLAYADNVFPGTDSLVVSYNPNCKDSIPLLSLSGSSLITTSRITSGFTPNANEWKEVTVDLKALFDKSVASLRFENFSKGNNPIYIDDINIYWESQKMHIFAFPNPAHYMLNLNFSFPGVQDVHIDVFNTVGQKVTSFDRTNTESFTHVIDVSGYAPAMYIIRATSQTQSAVVKIIVARD